MIPARLRLAWTILRDAAGRFLGVNGLFLSSALAFSLLLYSVPLILLVVAAMGQTVVGSERALPEVESILRQILPEGEQTAMQGLATAAANRRALGISGAVLFAVFSTATFGSARLGLNVLFGVDRRRGFLRGVGADALMILALSALFGVTIALNAALSVMRAAGGRIPLVGPLLDSNWFIASEVLGTAFVLALVYLVYRVCPAKTLRQTALVAAAVTSTVLLEFSRWAFGWYADAMRDMTVMYGAVGSLVFFILWLYYSSSVFFFGAAVGWAVDRLACRASSTGSPSG
jgi:membrane protein